MHSGTLVKHTTTSTPKGLQRTCCDPFGVVRRTDVEPRQKNGCDSVGVSHTAVKIVRQGVSNYSLPWPSCPVAIQKSSIGAFSGPKGRHSLCRWCKPPDDCTCSLPSHQRSAASPPIAGGNRVKGNPNPVPDGTGKGCFGPPGPDESGNKRTELKTFSTSATSQSVSRRKKWRLFLALKSFPCSPACLQCARPPSGSDAGFHAFPVVALRLPPANGL